jgi:hypothetical protein
MADRKFKHSQFVVVLRHYTIDVRCDGWWHDGDQRQFRFYDFGVKSDGSPDESDKATHDIFKLHENEVVGVIPADRTGEKKRGLSVG